MAGFCGNCGAPTVAGARFCDKCGTPVASQPVQAPVTPVPNTPAPGIAPPPPVPVAAAPAHQGSSAAVKIIFVVLGVFVFLALLAGGSCVYIAYRVKQRAQQYSAAMGGDTAPYTGSRAPCAMLSAAEASAALGQKVSSVSQVGMNSCDYSYGPGGSKQVAVQYQWEHGAMSLKMAHAAMKAVSGMETMTAVNGIGDEAYVSPGGSGFMMRKGDVMVSIDLRVNGVSVQQAEAMARTIASHL